MKQHANVIGSGPNGLAAAIVLARAGLDVTVYEAQAQPGGAARTLPLTLPRFLHDFGSAVHPLALASPFFNSLPLAGHGLQWIHSPAPLAHPLDDGTTVMLERNLDDAAAALGPDGAAWRELLLPVVEEWPAFCDAALAPVLRIPRNPRLLARFGLAALQPAQTLARRFNSPRTRALFAGLAAHSSLRLDQPLSSAVGLVLAAAAHAVGWPIPRGGSQSITDALLAELARSGGKLQTSLRIASMHQFDDESLTLCDVTPRQLLSIAGHKLSPGYTHALRRFQYGPGAFKVDYALSRPVPWRAPECRRAITVHLGGTMEEIAHAESLIAHGHPAERPFVLLVQPTLFDSTRAPVERHIVWAYCHVPNGSKADVSPYIDAQIERFAPGFRDCVIARHSLPPSQLESMDENLVGGDINGGAFTLRQFLLRPSIRGYATSAPDLYLCSASTPPGGGVHGMCGFNAATLALRRMRR